MRRKRLPPKPEPPPEGYMYNSLGNVVSIRYIEEWARYRVCYRSDTMPTWRNDPTYNMRLTKRPTATKEK